MSEGGAPPAGSWTWPAVVLTALVVAGVGLGVYGQGLDLLSDGLWLLGVRTWLRMGALYPHLAVDIAPGTFLFVAPFSALLGSGGVALAVAKAVSTGVCAAAGLVLARRAGGGALAWLAPVGTMALGPIHPALTALALTACAAGTDTARRRWPLALAVGALATFGVGPALAAAGLALATRHRSPRERLIPAAWAAVALLVSYGAAAGGDLARAGSMLARSTADVVAAITSGLPGRPWIAVFDSTWVVPFSGVATAESLAPLFGGHAALRQAAAGIWTVLPALTLGWAWLRRRRWTVSAQPAVVALALALGAWLFSPAARDAAWLATLWVVPGLLWTRARPAAVALATGVTILTCGPNLLEVGWLSLHARRPGLEVWERPHARVRMSKASIQHWESIFQALDPPGTPTPVLVWPHRPGLYVVFDLALPTRQATLLVGDAVDPGAVIEDLERSRPASVLLVLTDARATTRLRRHWPTLWAHLRAHYRVAGNVPTGGDPARVLERLDDPAAIERLSLPERLADVEIPVSNEAGPAMRPGMTVGQTVQVGATDLRGFSVRWRTGGRPLQAPARIRVWQRRGPKYDALLEFLDVQLVIPSDGYRSFLRFQEPIPDTAGKDLAITLELREDTVDELRLLWNRYDGTRRDADVYPEGSALVNRRPVPADLYFFSY